MNKPTSLSDSLSITLKEFNLQNVSYDLAESVLDSVLDDGVLKDIPIIGSIVGLGKAAISINDKIFIKKIIHFLTQIDVDPIERKEIIDKIESSKKYKIKVGEKLLFIVDRSEDHISANYLAQLFNAFLKKNLSYSDFLRGSNLIENLFIEDFEYFLKTSEGILSRMIDTNLDFDVREGVENNLITSGLLRSQSINTSGTKHLTQVDVKQISISPIGKKLKENIIPL